MRFRVLLMLAIGLLAAGCTGQPAATATPSSGETPAADATAAGLIIVTREPGTELPPGGLEVPSVGTLVASETEDPNAGMPFDSIQLVRAGGSAESPETVTISINADGSYNRDGTAGVLSPERVQAIIDLIDQVNFFGMQGTLMGPSVGSGVYQYALTITRVGVSRTIASTDGFMPQAYIQLVGAIFETGLRP
jgi:hypothetical protein